VNPLPVRVDLQPGQALDDYLHRIRRANGMTPLEMSWALRAPGATTRHLMVRPHPRTVARIADLAEAIPQQITAATLAAFDHGLPLDLHDVLDTRAGLRAPPARGWLRATGTQACPACLREGTPWQIGWRLAWSTTCTHHTLHLVGTCPQCRKPFRHRPTVLGSDSAGATTCDSTTATGHCTFDAAAAPQRAANQASIERQRCTDDATAGRPVPARGRTVPPAIYLADLRHLTTLLLHLAGQPGPHRESHEWTCDRRLRTVTTTGRARRWAITPPDDADLRAAALDTADIILRAPDDRMARAHLSEWVAAVPANGGTRWAWIKDRTTVTPTLRQLLDPATDRHRRVSTLASRMTTRLPVAAIPQRIPTDVYEDCLGSALRTRTETGAAYVSLCLARATTGADTWAAAAESLGLDPKHGTACARAASMRTDISADQLRDRLRVVARRLNSALDYRAHEHTIRALAADPAWFDTWRSREAPDTSPASLPYAITWLWTHTSHGLLATTPGWTSPPTNAQRGAYRAFASRPAAARLADLLQIQNRGAVA